MPVVALFLSLFGASASAWIARQSRNVVLVTIYLHRSFSSGVLPPCGTRTHSRAPRVRHSYCLEFFSQASLLPLHIQSGRPFVIGSPNNKLPMDFVELDQSIGILDFRFRAKNRQPEATPTLGYVRMAHHPPTTAFLVHGGAGLRRTEHQSECVSIRLILAASDIPMDDCFWERAT